MAAKAKVERVCVIVRGQSWESPAEGRACTSLRHSHMTLARAEQLEAEGLMERVPGEDASGKSVRIPVYRFVEKLRWAARPSQPRTLRVMQLVP